MSESVHLPLHPIAYGTWSPPVCVRHGEPPADYRKIEFANKTPLWIFILIPFSLLIAALIQMAMRKTVKLERWPVCATCMDKRTTYGSLALVCSLGSLPAGLLTGQLSMEAGWVVGIALLLVGLVFAVLMSWPTLLGVDYRPETQTLRLRKPHPNLVAALPPIEHLLGPYVAPCLRRDGLLPRPLPSSLE